jgi:hypothetical protein
LLTGICDEELCGSSFTVFSLITSRLNTNVFSPIISGRLREKM